MSHSALFAFPRPTCLRNTNYSSPIYSPPAATIVRSRLWPLNSNPQHAPAALARRSSPQLSPSHPARLPQVLPRYRSFSLNAPSFRNPGLSTLPPTGFSFPWGNTPPAPSGTVSATFPALTSFAPSCPRSSIPSSSAPLICPPGIPVSPIQSHAGWPFICIASYCVFSSIVHCIGACLSYCRRSPHLSVAHKIAYGYYMAFKLATLVSPPSNLRGCYHYYGLHID